MEVENLLSDEPDGVVPIEKYPLMETYKEGPHYDITCTLWYTAVREIALPHSVLNYMP